MFREPQEENKVCCCLCDNLDGLECFYTTFTDEQSEFLVQLCKQNHLFMCGGSDCHGTVKVNHDIGTGRGNLNIDESIVQNWVSTIRYI